MHRRGKSRKNGGLLSNSGAQIVCPPPEHCERCGADVQGDPDKPIRHQVFELPQIEPLITKYVRLSGVCSGCGLKHHGALPVGVPTGQLGARALALVGTLAGQFHLTQRKVQAVLSHIMGIRFSLGAVSQAHGLVAQGLAKPVAQLHTQLQHAPVCHADETRHQSHAHTLWNWALVSDWGAKFTIDPSRGQLAAKLVLGEQPRFVTVSDRYAGYNYLSLEQRQVCWGTCCGISSASLGDAAWRARLASGCWPMVSCCFAGVVKSREPNTSVGCKSASGRKWSWPRPKPNAATRPTLVRT